MALFSFMDEHMGDGSRPKTPCMCVRGVGIDDDSTVWALIGFKSALPKLGLVQWNTNGHIGQRNQY